MDIPSLIKSVETRAHVNIALIKYWGKKDDLFKVPHQSSISLTLDKFYTDTVISKSTNDFDELLINGIKATNNELKRIVSYLDLFRKTYHVNDFFIIDSTNYVYKAAGLASSASAFASIALGLNEICDLQLDDANLSKLARLGSGSASRSIYGGFARWDHGDNHDNSYASPIDLEWDDLVMAFIIVNKNEKQISSSQAMKESVLHSSYDRYLTQSKQDFTNLLGVLKTKDLTKVGPIVERNSNLMHDTIRMLGIDFYQDKTYEIINRIKDIKMTFPLYYTIDAGPNVKVLIEAKNLDKMLDKFSDFEVIVSRKGPKAYVKNINYW